MPEHLRALVVIMAAALAVFWLARRPACAFVMAPDDFKRRRNAWIAITLCAFLAHNYWVYVALTACIAAMLAMRDRTPLALYALLIFGIPMYDMPIPGFGLVDHLFEINHVRLLNLVILLPFALQLARSGSGRQLVITDYLFGLYLLVLVILNAANLALTEAMRSTFYVFLDLFLPYYAFTRGIRRPEDVRQILLALVLGLAIQGLIGLAEMLRSWLLYSSLRVALGADRWNYMVYLFRGEGGALRANASVGNSIVLGYVMSVGIVLMLYLGPLLRSRMAVLLGLAALAGGVVASLSRGPWLGLALMLAVFVAMGPRKIRRILAAGALATATLGVLLISPYEQTVIDHLPFVGTVETENIDYRERLLEVSLIVAQQNLWFGTFDFLRNPLMEQMRQGQGIIDVVNSYLQVLLAYGLVGMTLFILVLASALLLAWNGHRRVQRISDEAERLGRVLCAAMVGTMLTIFTVSSISVIPHVYWMLTALCVAYAGMMRELAPRGRPARPAAGTAPYGRAA